jgi:hypothetical protein
MDEKGAFVDEWPDGFFEEGFDNAYSFCRSDRFDPLMLKINRCGAATLS